MSGLIEALNIFLKYQDEEYPTHCVHDKLIVVIDPAEVSAEDIAKLEDLGFTADPQDCCFYSYHYGSC